MFDPVIAFTLLPVFFRKTDTHSVCFISFRPLGCPLDPHALPIGDGLFFPFCFVRSWVGYIGQFQIEMLEMQVEARLIRRTQDLSISPSGTRRSGIGIQLGEDNDLESKSALITAEFKSWTRLFSRKFIDRTWIGILMMVFQRTCG